MKLSEDAKEWAKRIGVDAALLAYNGLSDDYIGAYVARKLRISGEPVNKMFSEAHKSCLSAYAKLQSCAKLQGADEPLLACRSPQGDFAFFKPSDIDKVTAANWLRIHLVRAQRLPGAGCI
jgi:hypothetical protein